VTFGVMETKPTAQSLFGIPVHRAGVLRFSLGHSI
jgi:hypothetical protein